MRPSKSSTAAPTWKCENGACAFFRAASAASISASIIDSETVAQPSGCRIETRLDAWRYEIEKRAPRRVSTRQTRVSAPRKLGVHCGISYFQPWQHSLQQAYQPV